MSLTRREALLRLTALFGGTVFGAHRFLAGETTASMGSGGADLPLSAPDAAVLGEVADTILPATKASGGAKDAGIVAFIQETARDYYDGKERALLLRAPRFFNAAAAERYNDRDFLALNPDERFQLLLGFERAPSMPDEYRMVKQLTVWGYWTSEVAAKQALVYLPVPGVYRGCVDAAPHAKATF